jgi:hypothetical protein
MVAAECAIVFVTDLLGFWRGKDQFQAEIFTGSSGGWPQSRLRAEIFTCLPFFGAQRALGEDF